MRAALGISAALLVFSSAGFGCVFAFAQSIHHGPALAALAVCMALGLEVAKPFSVESVFSCLRRLAIARAVMMAGLAAVAIAYSLTAELSLMATARGDVTAGREAVADARQIAKDARGRALAELATLGPSRPAGELQALLAGKDCTTGGRATRALCAELGRATRRAELGSQLHLVEVDVTTRAAVGQADAGAVALATLLDQFGWTVPAGSLSVWLILVGVLALEAGSALAVVLVRSMPARRPYTADADDRAPELSAVSAPAVGPNPGPPGDRQAVADAIVAKARAGGGRVEGASVRALAKAVRATKTTTHAAIAALLADGTLVRVGGDLVLAAQPLRLVS
jgi:hypothetical protein